MERDCEDITLTTVGVVLFLLSGSLVMFYYFHPTALTMPATQPNSTIRLEHTGNHTTPVLEQQAEKSDSVTSPPSDMDLKPALEQQEAQSGSVTAPPSDMVTPEVGSLISPPQEIAQGIAD